MKTRKHNPILLLLLLYINTFSMYGSVNEPPRNFYQEDNYANYNNKPIESEGEVLLKGILDGVTNPRNIISLNELGKRMLRTMHLDKKSFERDYKKYLEEERLKQEYEEVNTTNRKQNKPKQSDYFYP